MNQTPYQFLEQKHPKLKKELEKHVLRNKVMLFVTDYLKSENSSKQ